MKPSYWTCGAGSEGGECEHWDDINGCWANQTEYCGHNEEDGSEEQETEVRD